MMNIFQYTEYLRNLADESSGEVVVRSIVPAANELRANIENRIAREGKDSKGNRLKSYSTKPAYFTRDQYVTKGKFKPSGKNSKSKTFKNGNARKSAYMEHGYKQLREVQGRQTNHKDLTYSGDMFRSLVVGREDDAVLIGFDNEEQSRKRKANEKREGTTIFKASEKETQEYNDAFLKNYTENIKKIIT